MLIFFEAEHVISIRMQSRFPPKCYCYASKSAPQNSITAAIGARLQTSVLRLYGKQRNGQAKPCITPKNK